MTGLLDTLPPELDARTTEAEPGVQLAASPMLATLSARRDFAAGWVFERKLDGIRVLAVREGDTLTLRSRSGRRLDTTYPEIVDALAAQACADFTIDGEIVAYSHGRTDFARLQQRMGLTRPADVAASKVAVTYYVFDLLRLDGKDVRRLPLRTRKSLLRRALTFAAPLRFTTHRNEGGADLLDDACRRGWEGLIAKRADSTYRTRRSDDWLKLKCARSQDGSFALFLPMTAHAGRSAGSQVGVGPVPERRAPSCVLAFGLGVVGGRPVHPVRCSQSSNVIRAGCRRRRRLMSRSRAQRSRSAKNWNIAA
ncbi:ATP-dependent DNA ligase [Streptomyces violascens]|uniref:ATP-dependent DNA ligase n=1 Tax=Streptomyces violascens TaxID=67381 RepID=UPI00364A1C02